MKIIIDIPDDKIPTKQEIIDTYIHFIDGKVCEFGGYSFMVLPEGHGRLVDVDKLFRHCGIRDYNCCGDCDKCDYYVVSVNDIREAKTIIEADKGE